MKMEHIDCETEKTREGLVVLKYLKGCHWEWGSDVSLWRME